MFQWNFCPVIVIAAQHGSLANVVCLLQHGARIDDTDEVFLSLNVAVFLVFWVEFQIDKHCWMEEEP